ncbi:MAG: DNA polymerase III subunit alpha, partial [Candidatus Colwellbacteria bacterium]|nr:DNA polymerase III subunit alpha [Candidatus Colwellbacteria bacterium]
KPIIGAELYVAPRSYLSKDPQIDSTRYHLTLLVKNAEGYQNLCELITRSNLEGFYYRPRVDKELIAQHRGGLICLSGCFAGEFARLLSLGKREEATRVAEFYRSVFGEDFYIELQPHTRELHDAMIRIARELGVQTVATQDSHYLRKEDQSAHEVLLAVQTNNRVQDADRLSLKTYDLSLRSPEEMAELFAHIPESLENTQSVVEKCSFEFELGKTKLPPFPLPSNETPESYLRALALERLAKRIPDAGAAERDRLEYELSVIEKTGYATYFLIVADLVNWARDHGIMVGPGRGSGAGSLVAYALGITNVNPLPYDLLFERFLNPERVQMPDIDLDFGDERREEVVGYLRERYGEDRVAQIITFGTMAARAAVRDAGRALGYSYGAVDAIAKLVPFEPNQDKSTSRLDAHLEDVAELREAYEKNPDVKKIIDAARGLEGVARHVSVHAAGVVVSPRPLIEVMPLQRSPQDEHAIITQFEMHAVEDLGLLKIDVLGLRNLTVIERTLTLLRERGTELDIYSLPLDSGKVYELFRRGETVGVFQFESAGMTRGLVSMQANRFEDLIAMVALFRPGPIELIPRYIARKKGEEPISYLHPALEPILANTYGVITYQEQLMRIARDLAGFTLGEADILRKAVGKKIKKLLDEQAEKFISGVERTMDNRKLGEDLWRLVEPFARYGFNKAHSVCYALVAYQTAYLKAHHPLEFMTSLLNGDAGDTERIATIAAECKKMGLAVLPPDVNRSYAEFVPEGGGIRFGLLTIKNIGGHIAQAIVDERMRGGVFKSFEDFLSRVTHKDLNRKSIETLAKSGALDSFAIERNAILANLDAILKSLSVFRKGVGSAENSLFGASERAISLKLAPAPAAARNEKLQWEKELLGVYLGEHPLQRFNHHLNGFHTIADALTLREGSLAYVAGVVGAVKEINDKKGQPMLFAKIDDASNTIEALVFNTVHAGTRAIWKEGATLAVKGRVTKRN